MGALTTTANTITYTGDGVLLAFAFPYLFYANGDLNVYLNDTTVTTAPVLQTITTHYSLGATDAGNPAGGTVTMVTEPTSDEEVIIERIVDYTQDSAYVNYNRFPAPTVEKGLNRLAMSDQQLAEQIARCLKFGLETTAIGDIPAPVGDKILGFNAGGTAWELKAVADIGDASFPASGLLVSQGTDTYLGRSIAVVGTDVTLTNADGGSGNPTLDFTDMDTKLALPTIKSISGSFTTDNTNNRTITTGVPVGSTLVDIVLQHDTGAKNVRWFASLTGFHANIPSVGLVANATDRFTISGLDFIVGSLTGSPNNGSSDTVYWTVYYE